MPMLSGLLGAAAIAVPVAVLLATGAIGSSTVTRTIETPATTAASDGQSATTSEIYERAQGSVVYVEADATQRTPFGRAEQEQTGSGFVLTGDGYIVTNEHVVEGATDVRVRVGAEGEEVSARVVGTDASTDVALLKLDTSRTGQLTPLPLGDSSSVQVGDAAIAIGSPFGLEGSVSTGVISALDREIESPNGSTIDGALQTDAAINPGSSGGPLLDAQGRAIGINSQIATNSGSNSGVGFAVPIDTVKRVVSGMENGLRL